MIVMIEDLIVKGYVYVKDGYVLFWVWFYENYGVFLGWLVDDMIVGVWVEVVLFKEDLMDFVFWKLLDEDIFGWDSLWGCGCLGWYIECFVMLYELLGVLFDIYGGGNDL